MSLAATRHADQAAALVRIVQASAWGLPALAAVRSLGLGPWCIGAGALRNLVWDHLHGHALPTPPADVDLAYFDADDLGAEAECAVQERITARLPGLPWEATNQARVHRWFEAHFGHAVAPLRSLHEAVASWPEFATCVGVWLDAAGAVRVIAPHGLDDLFALRVRRNPQRVSLASYARRVAQKRYAERWPRVTVEPA